MTLTEAAHWTKKLIWFVAAGFILFIVLVIVIVNKSRPQQLPQYIFPDFACTQTKEEFLRHKLNIDSIEYTLESSENAFVFETPSGKIDQLPEVINVYRYNNPGQYLTVQDDAKRLADALGFEGEMQRIGTTVYRWADSNHRTLTVQARNFTFDLKIDLAESTALPKEALPSEDDAKKTARDVLTNLELLYRDYSDQEPETFDITIEKDGSFREGKYKDETDLIRVDFVRKASMITIPSNVAGADEMRNMWERKGYRSTEEEVQTPDGKLTLYKFNAWMTSIDPFKSNISVYVGGANPDLRGRGINRIYGIEYKNWVVEPEYCGTYKLLTPGEVLTNVQNEKASLVYLYEKDSDFILQDGSKNVRNFRITDIDIFYYDAPHEQEFLQPIYVIRGEATFTTGRTGEFMFFHHAIDYDFIQDRQLPEQEEELL